MNTTGYSLFIIPTGETYSILKKLVDKLATECSSLPFEPHLTILPQIFLEKEEIVRKTQELVVNIRSFKIESGDLGYGDSYFKNLYIKINSNPTLTQLHQRAEILFEKVGQYQMDPHISLLYGTHLEKTKQKLIKELNGLKFEFIVDKISLFNTEGEENEWVKVKDFPLEPSN